MSFSAIVVQWLTAEYDVIDICSDEAIKHLLVLFWCVGTRCRNLLWYRRNVYESSCVRVGEVFVSYE